MAKAKTDRFFKTKNDLPRRTREHIITLLNARLTDAIDLQLQAKQAHWNVKGPQFIALHELFDKVADAAEEAVDMLAERAVQLGGVAVGTSSAVASGSKLPAYPLSAVDGLQHVEALSTSQARFGELVRKAIDEADKLGDADTADLFTEISREADKYLWFVEAHKQG
jgi:starvation-inducible DNA-binding protein